MPSKKFMDELLSAFKDREIISVIEELILPQITDATTPLLTRINLLEEENKLLVADLKEISTPQPVVMPAKNEKGGNPLLAAVHKDG